MKTIQIIVSPQGQATVQTQGFTGPACREASRFLEQALGRRVSEELTSEFHLIPPIQQAEQQRLG